jgi:hypothetical protein
MMVLMISAGGAMRCLQDAMAGELIVSAAAAEAADMATADLKRRILEIRGRTEPIEVIVLPAVIQDAVTSS